MGNLEATFWPSPVLLHAGEERKLLVQSWLISNALGGRRARSLAVQMQKAGRGLVPWAGVAVPLHPSQDAILEPSAETEADHSLMESPAATPARALMGQAFCFLPLPCSTGDALLFKTLPSGAFLASSFHAEMADMQYVTKEQLQGVPVIVQFFLRVPTKARDVLCSQVFQCMSTATLS